jgi:hypothetical protein
VLLTREDVLANQFLDGPIGTGTRETGSIPLRNPDNSTEVIGDYSYMVTFTTEFDNVTSQIGCVGFGAYTFGLGQQITFTASCAGLPFFSITGGQGRFTGAAGFSEFLIPVEEGSLHRISLCEAK